MAVFQLEGVPYTATESCTSPARLSICLSVCLSLSLSLAFNNACGHRWEFSNWNVYHYTGPPPPTPPAAAKSRRLSLMGFIAMLRHCGALLAGADDGEGEEGLLDTQKVATVFRLVNR